MRGFDTEPVSEGGDTGPTYDSPGGRFEGAMEIKSPADIQAAAQNTNEPELVPVNLKDLSTHSDLARQEEQGTFVYGDGYHGERVGADGNVIPGTAPQGGDQRFDVDEALRSRDERSARLGFTDEA